MNIIRLENWSVTSGFADGVDERYIPPEHQAKSLQGNVYNHPDFADGTFIITGAIKEIKDGLVYTKRSVYKLGEVEADFVKWCHEQGCHIPTPEQPFLLKKV